MPSDSYSHTQMSVYPKMTTVDGKICKPSRKTFERQCKQLADEIHIIHTKLTDNKAHLNVLFATLEKLREERTAKFVEKGLVEGSVNAMSVNINKLSDKLAQLQSKLHYRDMKKLEDAIRTLQQHLDSCHFKRFEEKKIVAEIDKLNRSKKVVGEYLGTQKELKELRSSQHSKRVDRDKLIKEIVAIRNREEDTREKILTSKYQETQLHTDMEELKDHKSSLKEEFTKHQQTFAEQKASLKQAEIECRQRQQQNNRLCHFAQTRCLSTKPNVDEPQTAEMVNCQKLIEFCERISKQLVDEKAKHRQKKKKISYTTDVFAQFVSIDICPPMTVAQACECVPLLQQKLIDLRQTHTTLPIMEEIAHDDIDIDHTIPSCAVKVEVTPCDPSPMAASDTEPISTTTEDPYLEEEGDVESEHPDDQSEKSLLGKQLSGASDEDTIESIAYKLQVLDSLCNTSDKATDNLIA